MISDAPDGAPASPGTPYGPQLHRAPSADDLRRSGVRTSVANLIKRLPAVVSRRFQPSPSRPADPSPSTPRAAPVPAARSAADAPSLHPGRKRKRREDERVPAAPAAPPWRRPGRVWPTPLKYDRYPHIVEDILQLCDIGTLLAFRRTCQALGAIADARLQRLAESDPRHGTPLDRRMTWECGRHRRTRLPRYTAIDWVFVHGAGLNVFNAEDPVNLTVPPNTQRHVVYIAFEVPANLSAAESHLISEAVRLTIVPLYLSQRPRFVDIIFVPDYLGPPLHPPDMYNSESNPFLGGGHHPNPPGMLGELAWSFNIFQHISGQGAVRFIGLETLTATLIESTTVSPLRGERLSRAAMEATVAAFQEDFTGRRPGEDTFVMLKNCSSRLMAEKRKF
ncbi:hypothetical protein Q8F55_004845 [Vanrija albida]|uniref:F-box domain-containing protein n=1 Tax=Vanrija albida TaxID=181172 RepID=A0ABR3Q0Z1_9TREE